MEIAVVVGTRPELVKMAPVIRAAQNRTDCNLHLIHTGQHYDQSLSGAFFEELGLPTPEADLGVGSCSPPRQVALVMERLEAQFEKHPPSLVLAEGDTNSVLATALVSCKLNINFGHVEAGLRCFDPKMPEEMNRVLADRCARECFAPTPRALLNLAFEGISLSRIYVTGNTVVDACMQHLQIARDKSQVSGRLGINPAEKFLLVTVHRQENTDNPEKLKGLVRILRSLRDFRIVFPVHPRTRLALRREGLWGILSSMSNVIATEPLAYLDFLFLEAHAFAILTDSGGVQEEALSLKVPCITLRPRTERPEGVKLGLSIITDMDVKGVRKAVTYYSDQTVRDSLRSVVNPLGDGKAGERIAEICAREETSTRNKEANSREKGCPDYVLADLDSADLKGDGILCFFDPEGNATQTPPLDETPGWKVLVRN